MFKIPKIEPAKKYIDLAISNMQKFAETERDKIGNRWKNSASTQRKTKDEVNLNKRKDLELQKIRYLNDSIIKALKNIVKSFPNFEKTDKIYLDLINTNEVGVAELKKSLSTIIWITNKIDELSQNTEYKIKKAKSHDTIGFTMGKYLGKVNSYFRKEKQHFINLEEARKFMNKLPKFEDLFTVSIAGFPNVGKSTLMKKMTNSNVEIQNYPFTTKGLMFGYLEENSVKAIQLIDTPGLLNRGKNNLIEQRAEIVITTYCDKIVFVIDFTESCGYKIEEQIKLLKRTADLGKKVEIYLSKSDMFTRENKELVDEYKSKISKFKQFTDSDKLKNYLIETYRERGNKFDPTKIRLIK